MPDIVVLPQILVTLRATIVAQVMNECLEKCGIPNCEKGLHKGIIDKHAIERITVKFWGSKRVHRGKFERVLKGRLIFYIDWKNLECCVTTDSDSILRALDSDKPFFMQLDPNLANVFESFVKTVKTKLNIESTEATVALRPEYKEDDKTLEDIKKFLGMPNVNREPYVEDTSAFDKLGYELKVASKNLPISMAMWLKND